MKAALDIYRYGMRRQYGFLSGSAAHDYLLERATGRMTPAARLLFRFLCRNEAVEEAELRRVLAGDEIEAYLRSGVFVRRPGALRLAVTVVPYGNGYYIADARHVLDHREAYGIQPVYLGDPTYFQVVHLRRLLKRFGPSRVLELGCGSGIVALELAFTGAAREGADIHARSIAFANANAALRRDEGVRFYESDLFSRVEGKFDLIIFAPWQPSERHEGLIVRFLEEAPRFLTERGAVFLWISTRWAKGNDPVIAAISEVLRAQGRRAERWIARSWIEPESREVRCASFLWVSPPATLPSRSSGEIVAARRDWSHAMLVGKTWIGRWVGRAHEVA